MEASESAYQKEASKSKAPYGSYEQRGEPPRPQSSGQEGNELDVFFSKMRQGASNAGFQSVASNAAPIQCH